MSRKSRSRPAPTVTTGSGTKAMGRKTFPRRDAGASAGEEAARLPWLDDPAPSADKAAEAGDRGKLRALLIGMVAAVALLAVGMWAMTQFDGASPDGDGQVIKSPGPYKTAPRDPGGMAVEGQGDVSYAASEGMNSAGQIDFDAIPEQPMDGARARANGPANSPTSAPAGSASLPPGAQNPSGVEAGPAQARKPGQPALTETLPRTADHLPANPGPAPRPSAPAPKPAAAPAAAGGWVQLGAYGSEAKANEVWKGLTQRFPALAPLTKSIQRVEGPNGAVFRLRAPAGSDAKSLCARLRVAGESCMVVD